ncbi:GtrA family protein [Chloroflexota bacterium]
MRILLPAKNDVKPRRFVQFCLVGLSGVGVNMGVFWFFTRIVGLSEPYDLVALILGVVASIFSNFVLNDIWTFRDRKMRGIKATLLRALKFNLVSVGALVLYYAIYTPLTRFTEIYDMLALLIAIGVGTIWNFSLNILWTWRKSDRDVSISP